MTKTALERAEAQKWLETVQGLEEHIRTLRELREYDRREKERLRNEIAYWKGFVPANIVRDFPFPQDKPGDAP